MYGKYDIFWLWIASLGKIRKDEIIGFLEFVVPGLKDELEENLRLAVVMGDIEIGQYQKLSLARSFDHINFDFIGPYQSITAGIPPMLLAAFLRNQGVANVDEFIRTIEQMIVDKGVRTKGTGLLFPVSNNVSEFLDEIRS